MTPFQKQVNRAKSQLQKTDLALRLAAHQTDAGNMELAYAAAFDFAREAERLTLMARLLPAYTGRPGAQKQMEALVTGILPVTVGYTAQGWFGIHMPALMPKKAKGTPDYIRLSLYLALGTYFKARPRIRFSECVIVIRHRYDKKRPERRMRDHDNIEVNAVVDAVSLFVMMDDAAYLCDHYYCSVQSDMDETEAYIIPRHEFIGWWLETGFSAAEKMQLT